MKMPWTRDVRMGNGYPFSRLRAEFLAYAQGQYPFTLPHNPEQPTRDWWLSICGQSNYIATKIFALRVNSMAEERTVSTFTWLTPPLRSQIVSVPAFRTIQKKEFPELGNTIHPATSDECDDSWLDEEPEHPASLSGLSLQFSYVNMNSSFLQSLLDDEVPTLVPVAPNNVPLPPLKGSGGDNDFSFTRFNLCIISLVSRLSVRWARRQHRKTPVT
ncbi:hypothetical protein GGX14DRAFT_594599 [Mycena pura]|uniref:Uncharacterized protein n=1 Tax=Mycena pura TaxID=153505 RepID=A0AAD6UQB6_9AGAR|nr:hypothetical protein GGX14DRAFT_594599 [Mycena pura]